MVEIIQGSEGDGGAGVEEEPGEPGYVSYAFALLFIEFINDNSSYVIYRQINMRAA